MDGQPLCNFVAGQEVTVDGEFSEVLDPATQRLLAKVPLSESGDVDRAASAARSAFESWHQEPLPRRARRMFALQALLHKHLDELAELVVLENGKHLAEARGEIERGIEVVELAASMTTLMKGETLEQVSQGVDTSLYKQPLGVVAAITPFNFPAMIPLWFAPLAITAGNTLILKPSPRTPLTAMRLAWLFAEADIPAGVFNVVHGANLTVEAIIDNPEVKAVSFVGSASAARSVYSRAAAAGKRVQALAGAKNHLVVMPDADLQAAAPAVFSSAFSNAGQRCLAGSVAVAVGDIADDLCDELAGLARKAEVGPGGNGGSDPGSVITPLTTAAAKQRITDWVADAEAGGARLLVDGRRDYADQGFYLGPTIFDQVNPQMRIANEEVFGPVLCVERMTELDQAIEAINASQYGNACAIFTASGAAARRFSHKVECGMVGVNVGVPAPVAYFPFAGWRGSFYGDLHATGRDGVEFFTQTKVITSRWPGI
jgi:malonate-semialdehyde dehydrogenase (acetylating)/methylmalonate-semialdehyde dehydrogenase